MQTLRPGPPNGGDPIPAFTPVPRKYRHDGWTADRQRSFIAALAETGSVQAAARRINMSPEGAYYLRRQPGADEFRAAWAAAQDHGVQTLTDIAIERALHGIPTPVFWRGEQVGERRSFNDRLLMFILRHHQPATYGAAAIGGGTRHPETIAREAAEHCPVCKARAADEAVDEDALSDQDCLEQIEARYIAKVRAERAQRLAGQIVAADFTLRQLTHIELVLDVGGRTHAMIQACTTLPAAPGEMEPDEAFASELNPYLDRLRRQAWAEAGEPERPPLALYTTSPGVAMWSGDDPAAHKERDTARRDAEARMAEAQAVWEATARPDSWAEWKARVADESVADA